MHFRSKFGDSSLNGWWVMVWTSSKWGKTFKLNLTLKIKVDHPQKQKGPNQGVLHLWSKFGDPSLNGRWVIVRTSSWLIHTHADPQTQAMTIPEGQNWPRVIKSYMSWTPSYYMDLNKITKHQLYSYNPLRLLRDLEAMSKSYLVKKAR